MTAGLAGRGVLCTGGAGGIGRAVCQAFAAAGARVLVVDRADPALDEITRELPGDGHAAYAADLRDLVTVTGLPAVAEERLGGLDVLVDMAAILRRRPVAEVTKADWDAQVDINLQSTFFLARACAADMVERGVDGRLVLYASQAWWTGGYGGALVYAATKAGVVSLTRGLAREYGPAGIRVNAVAPGCVDTPMLRDGLDPAVLDDILAATPVRRLGTPDEVAAATVFLASDNASFVTGTVLNVSGGWLTY